MARPQRQEMADTWYHVMNRGNDGMAIFRDDFDRSYFMQKLWPYCGKFCIDLDSYALMTSHFHMFLYTYEANLSRFMHDLESAYADYFNWRHERNGHLFQGRYKPIIVEQAGYGSNVNRYVQLNPVRGGHCSGKSLAERREALRNYMWSSYRAYLGLEPCPPHLNIETTLSGFGRNRTEQRMAYAQFVEEGLLRDIEDPFDDVTDRTLLGSETFLERLRRMFVERASDSGEEGDNLEPKVTPLPLEVVLDAVARAYNVDRNHLLKRRRGHSEPRRAAIWLACKWCGAKLTLREIGSAFGSVSSSGIYRARNRFRRQMDNDKSLRLRIEAMEEGLRCDLTM
jgi:hypothetical protein